MPILSKLLDSQQQNTEYLKHSGGHSTSENNVADLDDYNLFVQGISNRPEFYDFDQTHETEKTSDTCVENILSYQSKIDDSLTDNSDSDLESDYYYPISPKDSALMDLDLPLTGDEKSLIDGFCKELEDIVAKNDQGYRDKHENFTNIALKRIECITSKYLQKGIIQNVTMMSIL
ncbi:hypothetical protein EUZ93_01725 [Wolbachia pipientis]|nr:hypothetical protein [Wolbachia pipientis]